MSAQQTNRRASLWSFSFHLAFLLASVTPAYAALPQLILDGMKVSREKLESGVFLGSESTEYKDASYRSKVFCAFSRSNELRFDINLDSSVAGDREEFSVRRKIRLSDRVITMVGSTISIHPIGTEVQVAEVFRPWDIRMIGLGLPSHHQFRTTFTDVMEFLNSKIKKGEVVATRLNDSTCEFCVQYQYGSKSNPQLVENRFEINTDSYVPQKIDEYVMNPGSDDWVLQSHTQTEWTDVGGVSVPTKVTMESMSCKGLLELDWQSVNDELDRKHFDFASWPIETSTAVVDYRLGTPIEIDRLEKYEGRPVLTSSSSWLRWGIATMSIVAAILLGWYFRSDV